MDNAEAASTEEAVELFAWFDKRERWASVSTNFDRDGVYVNHQVVFYERNMGWVHAKPGNGLRAAIRNAMNMRFNYETGEYFNPPD